MYEDSEGHLYVSSQPHPAQRSPSAYSATSELDVVRGYSRPQSRRYGGPSTPRGHGRKEEHADDDDDDDDDGEYEYEGRQGHGHKSGGRGRMSRGRYHNEDDY